MRVSKTDSICGLAAPAARQLMRAYYDERPVEVACDILSVGQDAARDQMRALEAAGYIERTKLARAACEDWWVTTVKGNALANASFGKPISRTTAARLLAEVIERARTYNADSARLLTITEIIVFGSYLNPAINALGDLDLRVYGTPGQCQNLGRFVRRGHTPTEFVRSLERWMGSSSFGGNCPCAVLDGTSLAFCWASWGQHGVGIDSGRSEESAASGGAPGHTL